MVCIFVCCFLYCSLLQLTKVEGLLLPFLYIHTCVIFNKCVQTLKKNSNWEEKQILCISIWTPFKKVTEIGQGKGRA